jgi:hypothetical protein
LTSKNKNIRIFRTVIFHVVWNWCEIWSLILGEGYMQRVFEDRVLRKNCWAEGDQVKVDWKRQHNEELYDVSCTQNTVLFQ